MIVDIWTIRYRLTELSRRWIYESTGGFIVHHFVVKEQTQIIQGMRIVIGKRKNLAKCDHQSDLDAIEIIKLKTILQIVGVKCFEIN